MGDRIEVSPFPPLAPLEAKTQSWMRRKFEEIAHRINSHMSTKSRMTPIGGFAVQLTNKTGAATVAGNLVKADPATNDAVVLTGINDDECVGVFLDAGIPDGSEAWITVRGIAAVLYDDNVAAVRGDWVGTGQVGLARTQGAPPGLGVAAHFEEIGHAIESVSAGGGGTSILGRCILQFN